MPPLLRAGRRATACRRPPDCQQKWPLCGRVISVTSNIFNGFHIKKERMFVIILQQNESKKRDFCCFFWPFSVVFKGERGRFSLSAFFPSRALPIFARVTRTRNGFSFSVAGGLRRYLETLPPNGGRVSFPVTVRTADLRKEPAPAAARQSPREGSRLESTLCPPR